MNSGNIESVDGLESSVLRTSLRTELPPRAFAPNPRKLAEAALYIACLLAAYRLIALSRDVFWLGIGALLIGACHLSLGFIAHDVSHGSVIRSRRWRSLLESVLWGFNVTPAAVWIMNHNHIHHANTNAPDDVFRYFSAEERSSSRTLFSLLFFPNRHLPLSPLVFQTYVVQIVLHTGAAVLGVSRERGQGVLMNLGGYRAKDRIRLVIELGFIVASQVMVFHLVGGTLARYLWATALPFTLASAGASLYLHSQHGLHPLSTQNDPLGSTSLRLPRLIDRLHSFHGHHTAHHLFPSLNSDYYPVVTDLIARRHPRALHRIGMYECWKQLFKNDLYKAPPAPSRSAGAGEGVGMTRRQAPTSGSA